MQLAFLILGVANRRWRERLWVVFFFVDSACLRARLLACMDVGALWDRWSLWDVGEGEGEREREKECRWEGEMEAIWT